MHKRDLIKEMPSVLHALGYILSTRHVLLNIMKNLCVKYATMRVKKQKKPTLCKLLAKISTSTLTRP